MSTQAIVEQWERELREEWSRRTLIRLIRTRFEAIDAATESRVSKASVEELDRWLERVVVAERVEDVFE